MRLPNSEIKTEAIRLARASLGPRIVVDAQVEEHFGPDEEPIILVRIVLKKKLKVDESLALTYDLFTGLTGILEAQGDSRKPTMSYVQEKELSAGVRGDD